MKHLTALVSFQSPQAFFHLLDSRTKAGWPGLLLKTLTEATGSLSDRARTWAHLSPLPASPALSPWMTLPLWRSEAETAAEFSYAIWGEDKAHPPGMHHSLGPETMRGWHGVPRPTGSPGNRQGKGGAAEELAKRTALQKWFHFANSIAKTDGFSSQAGEQIIKSAFPRQSGLKSFILKIHTG